MKKYYCFFLIVFLFSVLTVSAQTQTAKDLFERGIEFLKTQKYSEALAAFQKSAQFEPKNAAAHGNIGASLMALKRPAEAVASFREAVRLAPNDGSFRTALCQSLSFTKNHTEAVSHCEEGVRLNSGAPESHAALIAALLAAKRNAEALQKAEIALQKFADNELLLNVSAESSAGAGNFARKAEIYETLARLKPNNAYYAVKLAESYLRLERDADALAAARRALETDPKQSLAHFFIGKIYFELGQNEEAAQSFQRAAEINDSFADSFYFLGVSEKRRGRSDEAAAAFRRAIALAPDNFEYQKELGLTLNSSAKYEEAIAPLKLAVKLAPDDLEAKAGLGVALFESANYEEGIQILTEANRLKPGEQVVQMFLSVARARQQSVSQIPEMIAFAKKNPQDLNVRLHLIQHLTYARRLNEAEPYFAEIWKLNPADVRVYDLIGTLHSTTGNYEKAAEAYRQSIEIGQSPAAYLGLATVYAKNGQVAETINAYNKVFEIKPDSPNIMKLYADYLRDNGKRREALTAYKKTLETLPTNAPALFNAGVLSAKLGDNDSAKQYLAMLNPIEPQLAKTLSRVIKFRW